MARSLFTQRKSKRGHHSLIQIVRRVLRKPEFLLVGVWKFDYQAAQKHSPQLTGLEIRELTLADQDEISSLAEFGFYTHTEEDVKQNLLQGEKCFIAKYNGQVISAFWMTGGGFFDGYLQQDFKLANHERYFLGAYTKKEFRKLGVLESLIREMPRLSGNLGFPICALVFIRLNNQASQRSFKKIGFRRCGYVGFLDLFVVRFNFLIGRKAFPQTARRCFLQLSR